MERCLKIQTKRLDFFFCNGRKAANNCKLYMKNIRFHTEGAVCRFYKNIISERQHIHTGQHILRLNRTHNICQNLYIFQSNGIVQACTVAAERTVSVQSAYAGFFPCGVKFFFQIFIG